MLITAVERVYVVRLSSHTSELRDLSHSTLWRSSPLVESRAYSNTSTFGGVCVGGGKEGLKGVVVGGLVWVWRG